MTLYFSIPVKTAPGLNAREHWAKRAARVRRERFAAKAILGRQTPREATITLTRYSAGTLDGDNLQGALKAIRDGVADAFGMADNDPRLIWLYEQRKCKRGTYSVEITITEAMESE